MTTGLAAAAGTTGAHQLLRCVRRSTAKSPRTSAPSSSSSPSINMSAIRQITRQLPKATTSYRSFSIAARRMAEGDAGAPRSGGAAQSDAFTKREQADENLYVRKQEQEKLAALKKKIADAEAQLAKDRKDAEDIVKKQ